MHPPSEKLLLRIVISALVGYFCYAAIRPKLRADAITRYTGYPMTYWDAFWSGCDIQVEYKELPP